MAKAKADDTSSETITKAEAVRTALAEGMTSPSEGVAYIKDKYGLDVTNQMFSSYKTAAKKKDGGTSAAVKLPKARPAKSGPIAVGGSPAELARQVKSLVDQYGAGEVSAMLSVLGG